jgi:hypothetical protein
MKLLPYQDDAQYRKEAGAGRAGMAHNYAQKSAEQ